MGMKRVRVALTTVVLGMLVAGICGARETARRPGISGIAFVRIGVGDLQTAASFYNGTLQLSNFKCIEQGAECFFVNPAQQVELVKQQAVPNGNRVEVIGLFTADAKALRQYLVSKGQMTGEIVTDSPGRVSFKMKDPENHVLEFVQATSGVAGSIAGPLPVGNRIIHAGFVVRDRAAMDKFYRDILGFRLYWHGGMKDGETDWVAMQVPDGTDWVEYMLNVPENADKHTLGVMNHISLGVASVKVAAEELEKNGVKLPEQTQMGRDGKWQLNLYDPDETRVELMEFTPVEKPCCAEFTGNHPKP
jgi:catechol 2,3-dioxygenase-like lactoylglutathione lyase family enzyme/predicted enzyme related to lactoylglutathione lyase